MALHSHRSASGAARFEPLEPRVHLSADFNGDGREDLVWHNDLTGANAVWYMNGAEILGRAPLQSVQDTDWIVAESGDFNGDGKGDLLWRNRVTGANALWLMDGTARIGSAWLPQLLDQAWRVRGVGDLDGDGDADILWHNGFSESTAYWRMDGVGRVGVVAVSGRPDHWYRLAGAADADGDGDADLYWVNSSFGYVHTQVWIMEEGVRKVIQGSPPGWTVIDPQAAGFIPVAVRDFDGDGIAEVFLRHPISGSNLLFRGDLAVPQATLTFMSGLRTAWLGRDAGYDRADLTFDGVGDLLWRNTVSGVNEVWSFNVGRGEARRFFLSPVPDAAWFIAAVADFNLDSSADVLWRNSNTGANAIWLMRHKERIVIDSLPALDPAWTLRAADDLGGDGAPDLLWHNPGSREVAAWTQTPGGEWESASLGALPAGNFTLRALTDIDLAGTRDMIWRDDDADLTLAWLMNGLAPVGSVNLTSPGAGWTLHAATDFDRDGWSDLLWREYDTGQTRLWRMNATTLVESIALPAFDATNIILGARDLDGDRNVEIVFHSRITGVVTIWRMRGVTPHSSFTAWSRAPSEWTPHFSP